MSTCCPCNIIKATCIEFVGAQIQITVVPFIPIPAKKYILCIDGIPLPAVDPATNPDIVLVIDGTIVPLFRCNGQDLTLRYFDVFKGFKCPRKPGILVSYAISPIPLFVAYRGIGTPKVNCFDGYDATPVVPIVAPTIDSNVFNEKGGVSNA